MTRRELHTFISGKRAEYGLTAADIPVEPMDMAARHGRALVVEYVPFASRKLRGMMCKGPVSLITLNARHGPEERRFGLAHELVHFWCDEEDRALYTGPLSRSPETAFREWRANEGAAELLVPREVFVPLAAGQAADVHRGHAAALLRDAPWLTAAAALFGVTDAVVRYRLSALRREIEASIVS